MPRIPEGQFRDTPSTRVGQGEQVKFDTPFNDRVRQVGGQFVKVADTLEKQEANIDSLRAAAKEEEALNARNEELEALKLASDKGMVEDEFGESEKYSERVRKLTEEYNTEATARLAGDNQAMSHYIRHIQPRLENYNAKARVFEKKQVADGLYSDGTKTVNTLHDRFLNGENVAPEIGAFSERLENEAQIMGAPRARMLRESMGLKIGLSADEYIRRNGIEPHNLHTANQAMEMLPDDVKKGMKVRVEKAVQEVKTAQHKELQKAGKEFREGTNSAKDISQNVFVGRDALSKLSRIGLRDGETQDERADLMSNYGGPIHAYKILSEGYGKNTLSKEIEGPRDSLVISDRENFSAQLKNSINEELDALNLHPTISRKRVAEEMHKKGMEEYSAYEQKKHTDFKGWLDGMDGSFEAAVASGDPRQVNMAVTRSFEVARSNGVSLDSVNIVSDKKAVDFGKELTSYQNGKDRNGEQMDASVQTFAQGFGDYPSMALRNAIERGGTTAKGSVVPSFIMLGHRMQDRGFAKETYGMISMEEANFAQVEGLTFKEFDTQVKQSINDSEFGALHISRQGRNLPYYNAVKEGVRARAIKYAGVDKLNPREAIARAQKDIENEFMVGKSGDNSVIIDRDSVESLSMTKDRAETLVGAAAQFKHLPAKPSMEGLLKLAEDNPFIESMLGDLESLGELDPEAKSEKLAELLNVRVVSDIDHPNHFQLMGQSPTGEMFPIPFEQSNGQVGGTSFSIKEYNASYNNGKEAAIAAKTQAKRDAFLRRQKGERFLDSPSKIIGLLGFTNTAGKFERVHKGSGDPFRYGHRSADVKRALAENVARKSTDTTPVPEVDRVMEAFEKDPLLLTKMPEEERDFTLKQLNMVPKPADEFTSQLGKASSVNVAESDNIVRHEGTVKNKMGEHIAYADSLGNPTGGIGHLLTKEERAKYPIGTPIPREQVEAWYKKDIAEADRIAKRVLPPNSPKEVHDIITNMAFNLGEPKLREMVTLTKALRVGNYKLAARRMRTFLWYRQLQKNVKPDQVGRAEELARRMERVGEAVALND